MRLYRIGFISSLCIKPEFILVWGKNKAEGLSEGSKIVNYLINGNRFYAWVDGVYRAAGCFHTFGLPEEFYTERPNLAGGTK